MLAATLAALGLTLGATGAGPLSVDATLALDPVQSVEATVSVDAALVAPAAGSFVAEVDFSTLQLRPVPGSCELTVSGQLRFDRGTLVGTAPGRTTALIAAPCAQVAATPPGTFADVFRFEGHFTGTVGGEPTSGPLTYAGVTAAGGSIDAVITLGGEPSAVLRADARVAEGGTYTGVVTG